MAYDHRGLSALDVTDNGRTFAYRTRDTLAQVTDAAYFARAPFQQGDRVRVEAGDGSADLRTTVDIVGAVMSEALAGGGGTVDTVARNAAAAAKGVTDTATLTGKAVLAAADTAAARTALDLDATYAGAAALSDVDAKADSALAAAAPAIALLTVENGQVVTRYGSDPAGTPGRPGWVQHPVASLTLTGSGPVVLPLPTDVRRGALSCRVRRASADAVLALASGYYTPEGWLPPLPAELGSVLTLRIDWNGIAADVTWDDALRLAGTGVPRAVIRGGAPLRGFAGAFEAECYPPAALWAGLRSGAAEVGARVALGASVSYAAFSLTPPAGASADLQAALYTAAADTPPIASTATFRALDVASLLAGGGASLPEITATPADPRLVAGTAAGATVLTLSAVPSGATRAYSGDGRLALNAAKTALVVGNTAHSAGTTIAGSVTDTLNGVTRSLPVSVPVVAAAASVPWRLPVSAATASGTTNDAAVGAALAASDTSTAPYTINIPPGGTAVLTLDVGEVGQHGAEAYLTNKVNSGARTWGIAARRSFNVGNTWAAMPGLPSGATWAPWAPSGAPTTINDRAQGLHIPAGAASRVELTVSNTDSANTMNLIWRGVRDMNSDARCVIGVMGNSRAVSAENHADWIAEIAALNPALDPMVLDLHRGSAKVAAIRTEQADYFAARFPRFTHLVHAENGNSTDTGKFTSAGAASNSTVQQDVDTYASLYDLYEQYPGRCFVGPLEGKVNRAIAADNLATAINTPLDGAGSTNGTFGEWTRWQRIPQVLARPGLKATSWDDALGCLRGGWDLYSLEDWENVLGNDGNHISGAANNAKARRGSGFAFAAIAGTAYKAPIVRLVEEAEAISGGITAARKARLLVLMDYLEAYTPTPTTAQANARTALRNRINAIGAGSGTGTAAPSVTGTIADVPGNAATVGQSVTLAVSRSPAGTSYVTVVNHDAEESRVQLASGETSVSVTFGAVPAAGRFYAVRYYDTATGNLIDEVAPVTVTAAGGSAAPGNTAAPTISSDPAISGAPRGGYKLTASPGGWTGSPTGYGYQWKRDGAAISGATAALYSLVAADVGTAIACTVTATNANGSTAATTAATAAVLAAVKATVGTAPTIGSSGSLSAPKVGDVLSRASGTVWNADPPVSTNTVRWRSGSVGINGATTPTYTITDADVGKQIDYTEVCTNNTAGTTISYSAKLPAAVAS